MAEPFVPLTVLSEAQRAQAFERFTIIRPALEEGVSQAQVARMEKRGYDAYTLNSLRRYVQALGEEFSLDIAVRWNTPPKTTSRMALNH